MSKVHALLKLTAVIARYLCFLVFRNNKFLTVLRRILGVSPFDRPCYILLWAVVIVEVKIVKCQHVYLISKPIIH